MEKELNMEPFNLIEESFKKEEENSEERIWTVYVHIVPKELVNKEHDMYYVGVTSSNPKNRWKNGSGYSNQYFGHEIKDLNWDDIQHVIIADHLTIDECSQFEQLLINKLNSFGEHGYNKDKGGGLKKLNTNVDLTGEIFGRLTVLNRNPDIHNEWICKCSCEKHSIVSAKTYELLNGNKVSCGCYIKDYMREKQFKHGMSNTKIFHIWSGLKYKKESVVCIEWLNDFVVFYDWAIQSGYKEVLFLLRKDISGDWSPSNCYWGTRDNFNRSKKSNLFFTYNGKTQTLQDWSNELGINRHTLHNRLFRSHMPVEKAFSLPLTGTESPSYNKAYIYEYNGEMHTLRELAEIYNIDLQKLRNRFRESNKDIYKTMKYLLEGK